MAQRTKASIEIDVKGLQAVNDLLNKLNTIDTKVNKINKLAGPKGREDQLSDQQKIETQINRLQTRSVKLRTQLVGLNEKDKKVQIIKARLTRAENKAAIGKFTAANRELAIAEKELATQKLTTAELQKQAKFAPKQALNFSKSGKLLQGPAGSSQNTGANLMRRFGPTQGFDAQSALISGAFPLLFGQGPVGAAAGFLGGGIGGMFGGMGGFAGGIAATAITQQIQTFLDGASKLGQALSPLVADFDAVATSLGLQNSVQEAQLRIIEETQGKTAAFNAALQIMAGRITQDGVDKLTNFGENTRLLGQQFAIAVTKLQAFAAGVANLVIRLTGLKEALEEREATRIVGDAAATGNSVAQGLVDRRESAEAMGGQGGEGKRKKALLDQIKLEERIFAIQQKVSVEVDQLTSKSSSLLLEKQKEFELQQRIAEIMKTGINKELATQTAEVEQIFDAEQKVLEIKQKQADAALRKAMVETNDKTLQASLLEKYLAISNQLEAQNQLRDNALELTEKLNTEADKMAEAFKALGDTVKNDIKEGIKGLIQGTSTLSDLLNNVADRFLSLAIDTMFDGPTGGGGIFGFLGGLFKAKGGPVKSGNPYIVGEKGPELFVPGSSGNIVPNNKLGGSGGGSPVGGTNIVVNVDASGSSVEGNEDEGRQLGRMIAAAIQSEIVKQKRPGGLL